MSTFEIIQIIRIVILAFLAGVVVGALGKSKIY